MTETPKETVVAYAQAETPADVQRAIDEKIALYLSSDHPAAAACARLLATGVFQTVHQWVITEIRGKTQQPAISWAVMELMSTLFGIVIPLSGDGDEHSVASDFARELFPRFQAHATVLEHARAVEREQKGTKQ